MRSSIRLGLPRLLLPVVAFATSSGCVPPYGPPAATEAHACATVVYRYDRTDGEHVYEQLEINGGWVIGDDRDRAKLSQAREVATLLRPGRNTISLWTIFYTDPSLQEEERAVKEGRYSGREIVRPCRERHTYLVTTNHDYRIQFTYLAPGSCKTVCTDRTENKSCVEEAE
jgi:hypothetical protein